MTVLETLKAAREQIVTEDRWCQNALAIDKDGFQISPRADKACRWCIIGAIEAVQENMDITCKTIAFLDKRLGCDVEHFNDSPLTTYQDVIGFLDGVIADLSKV